MKALIRKDFSYAKSLTKFSVYIIAIYSFMTFSIKNVYPLLGIGVFLSLTYINSFFTLEAKTNFDKYAKAIGIKPQSIVASRYISSFILSLVFFVLTLLASIIMTSFLPEIMDEDMSSAIIAMFLVSMVYISLLIPLLYKYGVTKSRIIFIMVFASIFLLMMGLVKLYKLLNLNFTNINSNLFILMSLIIAILVVIISYKSSLKIYNNKKY